MVIPRWTVYPAILLLVGLGVTMIPEEAADPFEGAALERRQGTGPARDYAHEPVIVLGIDGLDPELLALAIEEFPEHTQNFQWLIRQADGIQSLGTSTPPQSPVAWSNFITGLDPGGHGIFDFVHREKNTRGQLAPTVTSEDPFELDLPGQWLLSIPGDSKSNRTGDSFWHILDEHDVPADVWRIPANFPVEPSQGLSFPGMMTPVLDGSYGGATLYTTNSLAYPHAKHVVAVTNNGGVIDKSILGPHSPFKDADVPPESLYLKITVDEGSNSAAIDTGTEVLVLRPGEWSDFTPVSFDMLPMGVMPFGGVTRFYLRSIAPEFELYAAPVNFDPANPVTPVSEPDDASVELFEAIGYYYTQGMAEDVGSLKDGIITDGEFLQQVGLVFGQRMRMLDYALDSYLEDQEGGLLFFYFSSVDLTSHMMWRHSDPVHPGYVRGESVTDSSEFSGREGSTWASTIIDVILMTDPALGRVRERLGDEATFIVMSDHGFAPYRRKLNLNAWLLKEGYLVLREGQEERLENETVHIFDLTRLGEVPPDGEDDRPLVTVVDWEKTTAYGLGFNGLYVNQAGREGDHPATEDVERGIVAEADKDALLREIAAKLESLYDVDGTRIVNHGELSSEIYSSERRDEGPDMVVGYNAGYGCSDESTLGEIQPRARWIEDNVRGSFNGSHLMDPAVVPGTLISNRPVRPGDHQLQDLTVEILHRYGIEKLPGMQGHPVLED